MSDGNDALKERAIVAYAEIGVVAHACQAVGISRQTWYRWQEEDSGFKARVTEAEETAIDSLESEARRRAKDGSDTLLIFCLKAKRPEYRDRQQVDLTLKDETLPELDVEALKADIARLAVKALREGLVDGNGPGNTTP